MTTTSEAPEVWRVECEGGDVVTTTVVRARQGGSVAVCGSVDVWSATRDDAVPYYAREASGDTPRQAVTALAARGGLAVVAVLAPGQKTRAEVEAERDAADADEAARLREALRFLCRADVERCWFCGATATKRSPSTSWWCDVCAPSDAVDHEHAATLRPLLPPRGGAK